MITSDIATALAAGATVVTPNKRLARELTARYDAAQMAAGRHAWPAARALPWTGFLERLWLDALGAGVPHAPAQVISDGAAAHLWERIVRAGPVRLQDPQGAAAHARDAWRLFHAWREPAERIDGWAHAGIDDDAAVFARWAADYSVALNGAGAIDAAQLPDWLTTAAPRVGAWRALHVVTAGFVEMTRQQQRLFEVLRTNGATVGAAALSHDAAARLWQVTCTTPVDELAHALAWVRDAALASPAATIGLVVEDLAARREALVALADDILCPALAVDVAPDTPRPYDVSLGTPLSAVPVVAAALDLITLAGTSLPAGDAAVLLRSPFLDGARTAWPQRARAERIWRETGLRTIDLADAIDELATIDPALGARWRGARVPARGARSPQQWADEWRAWLAAVGWPGDTPPGSGEWQAREAWSRLLHTFGTLSAVSPTLGRDEAATALRALASATTWEPEAPPARIRILGVLEASGLTFDALWLAGFTADRWPRAPQPSPLLPLAWQRDRAVPRASAAGELAFARALTAGFAGAAREVVVSHARDADGLQRAGSAMMGDWPAMDVASLPVPLRHAHATARAAARLHSLADDRAPALAMESAVRGGAGVIESQSDCPFQAFARHRLRANAFPTEWEGLTPQERGTLLHTALATFWNDIHDSATLRSLSSAALAQGIEAAVALACAGLDRRRMRALPAAVVAGEARRLGAMIGAWLELEELPRPAFVVAETESTRTLAIGGIVLSLRLDRIDRLEGGGIAVVDYKSGRAVQPVRWFAKRPSGNQVGLYALACMTDADAPPVRAVAYAQLKAGEIKPVGLAADDSAWPVLPMPATMRTAPFEHWTEVQQWWAECLSALAANFRAGDAAVAPRNTECCRRCDLHALCRIRAMGDEFPVDDHDAP